MKAWLRVRSTMAGGSRRLGGVFVATLLLGVAPLAQAAPAPPTLRADVRPLALHPRPAAPSFIDVKLQLKQAAILEGVLEVQLFSDDDLVLTQKTAELVLTPGSTAQRILLPPMPDSRSSSISVRLSFDTRKESYDLGSFPLLGELSANRDYLIGACIHSSLGPESKLKFWQALRPEWLLPQSAQNTRSIASFPAWMNPEDLPSATGLCAFDALAMDGRSFAALTDKQLRELAVWVEAGGSLCVAPDNGLDSDHLTFLNRLTGSSPDMPAVTADPAGKLSLGGQALLLRKAGLGRLVVTLAPPADEAAILQPEWRKAILFLFKATHEQFQKGTLVRDQFGTEVYPSYDYDPNRSDHISGWLSARIPRNARMISPPVVIAVLGGFLLLVGPGEWLFLGWLRRRRWTWITFPALALGCTFTMVRLAESAIGLNDRRSTLILTDVGPGDRVLRENRFELLFTGRSRLTIEEQRQNITVPCKSDRYGSEYSKSAGIPAYEGVFPRHYALHQPVAQWQTYLLRSLSLAAGTQMEGLRTDSIDPRKFSVLPDQMLNNLLPPNAAFVVNRGQPKGTNNTYGLRELLISLSTLNGANRYGQNRPHWVSSLAPSGHAALADLAIHDPTDPGEWMVIVVKEPDRSKVSDQPIHVVRRLYHFDE